MVRSVLRDVFVVGLLVIPAIAQDPAPAKVPDKEVAEKITQLKEAAADKKFARDGEAVQAIDGLVMKMKAGVIEKDQQAITKALDNALNQGRLRPFDNIGLYTAAATALGFCGAEGSKALQSGYENKRFPKKKEWVPLRETLLRNIGKTKDESAVKFLCEEATRSPEAGLMAAAGEALGNFEESKDAVRKEIVNELIKKWGEEEEAASQSGSSNVQAQNAKDRLSAFTDKWNETISKLTRQSFHKFLEWQSWHNKNRNQPWE